MKVFFSSRNAARRFAAEQNIDRKIARVIDVRHSPFNGMFGWGVVIDTNK